MREAEMNKLKMRGADFKYRHFHQCFIWGLLITVIVIMSIVVENFATAYNFRNLFETAFTLLAVSMGQLLVILTGGIDLSISGMVSMANCVSIAIMTKMEGGPGVAAALIATFAACLLGGALNGFCVAKLRLPAIIVTIATCSVFNGISLLVMEIPGGSVNYGFADFINYKIMGFPVSFFIAVLFIAFTVILTTKAPLGKALRAVGGNESAAFGTGVNVVKTKFMAYLLSGFFCAIGGIFLGVRLYSADPNIGTTYAVYSITATVVGGTLMSGAVGEAMGTVAGVFIIYIINNILNLLGVDSYYQYACQGLVLIFALMIGCLEAKHRK